MKRSYLLLLIVLLCSFGGKRNNNSWSEAQLKGRVRSITEYESLGMPAKALSLRTIYKYDERGNETEENIYTKKDSLFISVKWSYKYNKAGRITEKKVYNKDGSTAWTLVYKYDKKGAVTGTVKYLANGDQDEKTTYKYDAKGNDIAELRYDKNGRLECKSAFKFNAAGIMVDALDDCSNIPFLTEDVRAITHEVYDNKGCLTEHREYDKNKTDIAGSKYSAYEFDKTGNWIKRTVVMQYRYSVDTVEYKREISYY